MEGVAFVAGLPGLVQSCVHGYRFVCTMIDMDKTATIMRLRYRIEESRLVLWGRFWGLLIPQDESLQGSVHDLKDLLRIPGMETLIYDILKQVITSLQEVQQMSERYSGTSSTSSSSLRAVTHGTKVKVRWAVKDKTDFEYFLMNLTSLNDGLEKLLPRLEKTRLGQALIGEVLAEEGINPAEGGATDLRVAFGGQAPDSVSASRPKREPQAQIMSRNVFRSDSRLDSDGGKAKDGDSESDKKHDPSSTARAPTRSMQIPLEWFIDMAANSDGFSMELVRLPADFESDLGDDKTNQSCESSQGAKSPNFVEESVFVEWRNYDDSAADEQLQMALDARREQVSHAFNRDNKERNHIVMHCLGYVLPDKSKMGLVFRPPANFAGSPVSLHNLMRDDFESASAIVPDLDDRIDLAKTLSTSLYQLQCSGWLHRKISSHNVVFFPMITEKGEQRVEISQPRLIGWQTARYDDQIDQDYSESMSERILERKNRWSAEELPYIHPARPAARIRFKRSFDVYALGIVLAEVAFWEPIDVMSGNNRGALFSDFNQSSDAPELQRFSELVISTCKKELAGEVGRKYRSAVLWALEGIKSWHAHRAATQIEATKEELDKEIGLEKAFFWNVVSQLSPSNESLT